MHEQQKLLQAIAADPYYKDPIGDWGIQKYDRLTYYANIFTTAMHKKWKHRVYIDLFAGPGAAITRDHNKPVLTSPIIALNQKHPFTHYIFCELENKKITALYNRVKQHFPQTHAYFFEGDVNQSIENVVQLLRTRVFLNNALIFCFVDPYAIGNLHFNTVKKLAAFRTDFLFLIPTHYDVNRNFLTYLQQRSENLDNFLGTSEWRRAWQRHEQRGTSPVKFILKFHAKQMATLGYQTPRIRDYKKVTISNKNNVPLYHLVLYSKHPLGLNFWRKTLLGTQNQLSFLDNLEEE